MSAMSQRGQSRYDQRTAPVVHDLPVIVRDRECPLPALSGHTQSRRGMSGFG